MNRLFISIAAYYLQIRCPNVRRLLSLLLNLLLKDWPLRWRTANGVEHKSKGRGDKAKRKRNITSRYNQTNYNFLWSQIIASMVFLFVSILEVKINYSTSRQKSVFFNFDFLFLLLHFTMEKPHRVPIKQFSLPKHPKSVCMENEFFTCCSNFWFLENWVPLIVNCYCCL